VSRPARPRLDRIAEGSLDERLRARNRARAQVSTVPRGFRYAGANAGIKAARKDLALVVSDVPCVAAGSFTVNKARAAPVEDAARRLPADGIRAVVVNSGNANALTGPEGEADVRRVHQAFAAALGIAPESVVSASTGVIGVRLPVAKLEAAATPIAHALAPSLETAAEAIMTTDTRPKIARRVLTIGGREVRVAAIAKGSGMIAPQMATMIGIVTTDLAIEKGALQKALDQAVDASFNRIVVDGDMSTNDCVFVLANGLAGNKPLTESSADFEEFCAALKFQCIELARAIAEDGEGATKLVEVRVEGAPDERIARDLSTSIAGSSLVKAAIFGADPNWGRVLSTVGARAGSQRFAIDPRAATVAIQGVVVYERGAPKPHDSIALRAKMREPHVHVYVKLVEGSAVATAWGCDLSYDYVKINADYTSTITASPEGTVTRDDRLTNYSPSFKRTLLVEALSYISKFSGKRAVVKYGGAAMVKDALKASFAGDVNLLRAVGLLPIVVHGGGPELAHTMQKLGKTEYGSSERMDASDVELVEMVLTGRTNQEIVSLLNRVSGTKGAPLAVGLSGKDAGLIRVRKKATAEGEEDLGMVGEITGINRDLLDMMLGKGYVPVVSPVGLGDDGEGYDVNADEVASEIAIAVGAEKLIYLTDVPGILLSGELVTDMTAEDARRRLAQGEIRGGMATKVRAALRALEGGVGSVHVLDGRTPHSVIAELFTDRGVGTLLRP
jgi:acetylglutamate kinase